MNSLAKQTGLSKPTNIVQPFQWRMSAGRGYISVKVMATRHLFNTLRMVWNMTMPADATLSRVTYDGFGPEYTPAYLKQAITCIYSELLGRDDVTPAMLADLKKMRDYLAKQGLHSQYLDKNRSNMLTADYRGITQK
jgi:hypothetical protein